jgi:very-short-patch-repair endonuclease
MTLTVSRNDDFANLWRNLGDPSIEWLREHRFHPERRWRFDFAHLPSLVAVEIEGVTHYGNRVSRHQTARGFGKDIEKYNAAVEHGWRVLRYTQHDLTKRPVQVVAQITSVITNTTLVRP